jgi:hypothetical protein
MIDLHASMYHAAMGRRSGKDKDLWEGMGFWTVGFYFWVFILVGLAVIFLVEHLASLPQSRDDLALVLGMLAGGWVCLRLRRWELGRKDSATDDSVDDA